MTNGWDEYKRLVVHELEQSTKRLGIIEKRLHKIEQKLTIVHTRVYMMASFISVVVAGLVNYFFNNQ